MLRAIREIQPTWVVGENVRGLTNWNGGMVFDEVQAEMETEGYEVTPFLLPACGVNAPHRRDRIWFIAHSISERTRQSTRGVNESRELLQATERQENKQFNQSTESSGAITNTGSGRRIQDNEQHASGESKYACSGWERFPTQSPVCNGNDGISAKLDGITFPKWRSESIKAGGNAIVPQVVYQIFKAIQQYEN